MITYQDTVQWCLDFIGASAGAASIRDIRKSIAEAIRDISNAHHWTYYYKTGRLNLNPPYQTGTVAYSVSAGTLTLTGGVWPSWSAYGYILIGRTLYTVNARVSDTVLTLDADTAPIADVASGTTYQLCCDTYQLPVDFVAQDLALYQGVFSWLTWCEPKDWMYNHRYRLGTGTPRLFTITGDEKFPGRLVIRLAPSPNTDFPVDFNYKRRPRPVGIQLSKGGSVTLDGSSAVAGVGTAFSANMVGSILRVSAVPVDRNGSPIPTGEDGESPALAEGFIKSVQSGTSFTLYGPAGVSVSGAGYAISDPIDIEGGSMQNAFLACCEYHVARHRLMDSADASYKRYLGELAKAKDADTRSFMGRSEGYGDATPRLRLRDMGPII